MTNGEFPKFPNYRGTFGTSLPVVGALMASISATLLAIPLVKEGGKRETIAVLPWDTDQMAVCFGTLALILFAYAAICGLYAHALAVDQLDEDTLKDMFSEWDEVQKKEKIAQWRKDGDDYYGKATVAWVDGASLICMTVGLIAYGKSWIVLPVLAGISAAIAIGNWRGGVFGFFNSIAFTGASIALTVFSLI